MKKGQGLSITTIVVAAIALLVLVVLVAIFTGQIGDTSKSMKDCKLTLHGECKSADEGCDILSGVTTYPGRNNCGDNKVCCIPLVSKPKTGVNKPAGNTVGDVNK